MVGNKSFFYDPRSIGKETTTGVVIEFIDGAKPYSICVLAAQVERRFSIDTENQVVAGLEPRLMRSCASRYGKSIDSSRS